jgi:hypothetical protein
MRSWFLWAMLLTMSPAMARAQEGLSAQADPQ